MTTVKKATSVLVMIVSVVLLLLMLAGVGGVWWGQGQLRGFVADLSATVNNTLASVQGVTTQVNTVVLNSQGRVDQVTATVTRAGATVEETRLALVAAERLLDTDLTPAVQRVSERVNDVRTTITVAEQTIRLWRRLPGAAGNNEMLNLAEEAIGKVTALQQSIVDLRTTIQNAKSGAIDRVVGTVTSPLNRVSGALGTVSATLGALDQRINAEQARLAEFTNRVLAGITVGAVVLSLAFLWIAFAQVGLFVHAYGVFTGRDPLARWHKGPANGVAAALPEPTSPA